mmetsp:Transcript_1020/g.2273  ORF Transcript_1020/g.2273 Transcript_1020/m.2273 type:complete len:222 (-) Transcript_1020:209-874(-)
MGCWREPSAWELDAGADGRRGLRRVEAPSHRVHETSGQIRPEGRRRCATLCRVGVDRQDRLPPRRSARGGGGPCSGSGSSSCCSCTCRAAVSPSRSVTPAQTQARGGGQVAVAQEAPVRPPDGSCCRDGGGDGHGPRTTAPAPSSHTRAAGAAAATAPRTIRCRHGRGRGRGAAVAALRTDDGSACRGCSRGCCGCCCCPARGRRGDGRTFATTTAPRCSR